MSQIPNNPEQPTAAPPSYPPGYPPPGYPPPYHPGYPPVNQRSPLLAAIFSFFLCGLGQVYAGLYQRGIVLFLSFAGVLAALVSRADDDTTGGEVVFLASSLGFLWFFNVLDAYRQTSLRAYGLGAEELAAPNRGNLGLGVALLVVGAYGLMRRFFDFDLGFLLDHWYLILIAIGGLFVFQALRAQNGQTSNTEE